MHRVAEKAQVEDHDFFGGARAGEKIFCVRFGHPAIAQFAGGQLRKWNWAVRRQMWECIGACREYTRPRSEKCLERNRGVRFYENTLMANNPTLYGASHLELDRCPHCRVANPLLSAIQNFNTQAGSLLAAYQWRVYVCSRCGLPVLGGCWHNEHQIREELIFPKPAQIGEGMPKKAQTFLTQALESVHAPSGAIMLCASSVDAMLKEKGLKSGSLYSRIEKAAEEHLITKEMSLWAHDVRLDANDERHADEHTPLPDEMDAKRCIDFVKALAEFLFILPARIEKGRSGKPEPEKKS